MSGVRRLIARLETSLRGQQRFPDTEELLRYDYVVDTRNVKHPVRRRFMATLVASATLYPPFVKVFLQTYTGVSAAPYVEELNWFVSHKDPFFARSERIASDLRTRRELPPQLDDLTRDLQKQIGVSPETVLPSIFLLAKAVFDTELVSEGFDVLLDQAFCSLSPTFSLHIHQEAISIAQMYDRQLATVLPSIQRLLEHDLASLSVEFCAALPLCDLVRIAKSSVDQGELLGLAYVAAALSLDSSIVSPNVIFSWLLLYGKNTPQLLWFVDKLPSDFLSSLPVCASRACLTILEPTATELEAQFNEFLQFV